MAGLRDIRKQQVSKVYFSYKQTTTVDMTGEKSYHVLNENRVSLFIKTILNIKLYCSNKKFNKPAYSMIFWIKRRLVSIELSSIELL